jgi:GxxExxY protein
MGEIIYKDESYQIMGACFEVYRHMDRGFLEPVYHECLTIEFAERSIPFIGRAKLPITYKGRPLEKTYEADFICYDKIIIEIKAVAALAGEHRGQLLNYLKATGMRLGILANFGSIHKLEYERIAR